MEKGRKLTDGLVKIAAEEGFHLVVSGAPSLFYLRTADDDSLMLHQAYIAEMVRRGVFMTNHHNHFINASLSDEDIAYTWQVAREAWAAVKEKRGE